MRSRRSAREDLRLAVDCLPRRTRVAMLEGIRSNDIIVGAYVDRKGGGGPVLAAPPCGGLPRREGRRLSGAPRPPLRRPARLPPLRARLGSLHPREPRPPRHGA